MNEFKKVSAEEFDQILKDCPASDTFKQQLKRFNLAAEEDSCYVHEGPLVISGNFEAPGFCTLILGDLNVEGVVDLANPDGLDEGGEFIVIGNVSCKAFSQEYGKMTMIDGNLQAREMIINSYEDSGLVVIGNLKTKFFYGVDIWAEVGGTAEMEYGIGYCLPLGYKEVSTQAIRPQHNEEISTQLLVDEKEADNATNEYYLKILLTEGKSVFK